MTTDLQLPEILSRLSAIPVRSDAEIREWTWRNEIRPILADAGFDGRFRERADWNLEPNQEKVFRVVRSKLLGEGAIIALVGIRGTGKTTISAQIAIQIAEEWVAYWNQSQRRENAPIGLPIYRKMLSIVEILKPLYSDHGSTRTDSLVAMRDALCSIGLLIIDEKHDGERLMSLEDLTDIIDRRYPPKRHYHHQQRVRCRVRAKHRRLYHLTFIGARNDRPLQLAVDESAKNKLLYKCTAIAHFGQMKIKCSVPRPGTPTQ